MIGYSFSPSQQADFIEIRIRCGVTVRHISSVSIPSVMCQLTLGWNSVIQTTIEPKLL